MQSKTIDNYLLTTLEGNNNSWKLLTEHYLDKSTEYIISNHTNLKHVNSLYYNNYILIIIRHFKNKQQNEKV